MAMCMGFIITTMKNKITITNLGTKDSARLDDLCNLRNDLSVHHEDYTSSERFRNFMLKHLGEDTMLTFLILDSNKPVGYGIAFDVIEHIYMPEWTRRGYISQYYVDASYRGQGVGKMGLNYIHQWFKSRGITEALLNVALDNEAGNKFWRKQGYVAYATRMICDLK